jgi:very-short-patch-repair endonuclease
MQPAKQLKVFQGRMRRKPTAPEKVILDRLKDNGIDFKFQMILGFYILDIVIPARMLVIEIDGTSHNSAKAKIYDASRTDFIERCGFSVIRLRNEIAESWSLNDIENYGKVSTDKMFRSGLAKANSLKSESITSRASGTRSMKVRKVLSPA